VKLPPIDAHDPKHEQAQRRLHAWPEWDASVRAARRRLRYHVRWFTESVFDWDGSPPKPPYWRWQGRGRLDDEARRVVVDVLGLSELFIPYWQACFLSYRPRRPETVRSLTGTLNDRAVRRLFPPADAMLLVTLHYQRGHPQPRLTIEGPAGLVTRATLTEASGAALRLIKTAGNARHRVLVDRQQRPKDAARAQVADKLAVQARALAAQGFTQEEIAEKIGRDARTVRRLLTR
jgi:hypothetical protein